jgi:hypothetical protein
MPGDFDEGKHDRANDGKFTSKGAGGGSRRKKNAALTAEERRVLSTFGGNMSDKARREAAGMSQGRMVAVAARLREKLGTSDLNKAAKAGGGTGDRKAKAAARAKEIVAKAREKAKALKARFAGAAKGTRGKAATQAQKAKHAEKKKAAAAKAKDIVAKAREKANALKAKAGGSPRATTDTGKSAATETAPTTTSSSPDMQSPAAAAIRNGMQSGDYSAAASALGGVIEQRGLASRNEPRAGHMSVSNEGLERPGGTAFATRKWDGEIQLSELAYSKLQKWSELVGDRKASAILNDPSTDSATRRAILENEDGISVIVHETLHGYSPIDKNGYAGVGGLIEEVTTEVYSRQLSNELFGVTVRGPGQGPYGDVIAAVTDAVAAVTGGSDADSFGALYKAADRFKRRTDRIKTPAKVLAAFAEDVAAATGTDAKRFIRAFNERIDAS